MPAKRLKKFLDENLVAYTVLEHPAAFTSQETAAAAHVRGRNFAKTVMATVGGELAMVVLPAHRKLYLERLRKVTGRWDVELATERQFKDAFPDCEVGAMPPFGQLYGMKVYADSELAAADSITFNAGTHDEAIQMAYLDFRRLVGPIEADLSYHLPAHA